MSKQAAIMAAELAKRSKGSSNSPGWLTSIVVNKIVNLLQVRVHDIHIRIEAEPIVSGGPSVAIGFLFHEMQSRSNQAVPGEQMLEVRGLSIYWDRDIEITKLDEASLAEVSALFEAWGNGDKAESLPSVHEDDDGDIFYVAPSDDARSVSVQHHWVLQTCDVDISGSLPLQDKSDLKLLVRIQALPVVLEVGQMWDMFRLLDWLQVVAIRKRYLHLRPQARVSDDRAGWWRYAMRAVASDLAASRSRLTWAHVRVHLGQRREYAQLYRLVLNNRACAQDRTQLAFLESQVPPPPPHHRPSPSRATPRHARPRLLAATPSVHTFTRVLLSNVHRVCPRRRWRAARAWRRTAAAGGHHVCARARGAGRQRGCSIGYVG